MNNTNKTILRENPSACQEILDCRAKNFKTNKPFFTWEEITKRLQDFGYFYTPGGIRCYWTRHRAAIMAHREPF